MASGLDIAMVASKTALKARQEEMAIIGNNVANANNEAYHRQSVSVYSNQSLLGDFGYYGTGVHVAQIVRQYDESLETSLRQATTDSAYKEAYAEYLGQTEDLFGPQGENPLNDAVMDFASALQTVASNPESTADRTAFLGAAENLADQFNQQYENLRKIRDGIADETSGDGGIQEQVDELNTLASQIPELNERIKELEENAFRDQKANDLRDQRDQIVSQMAELADITVTEGSDYRYTITIGGEAIVDGTVGPPTEVYEVSLSMTASSPHNTPTLTWATGPNTGGNVTLSSGKIKGLIDSREYVTSMMDDLYAFAEEFGDWAASTPPNSTVNAAHMAGFDLDGNAGGRLFSLTAATQPESGNILTLAITDARDVAASDSNTEIGNGTNASDIWTTLDTGLASLGQSSILDYSDQMLNSLAEDVRVAELQSETAEAVVSMFQNAVFEVSSVDMDEEMTEMLEVQRAFQAASKVINTISDMMDVVMAMA